MQPWEGAGFWFCLGMLIRPGSSDVSVQGAEPPVRGGSGGANPGHGCHQAALSGSNFLSPSLGADGASWGSRKQRLGEGKLRPNHHPSVCPAAEGARAHHMLPAPGSGGQSRSGREENSTGRFGSKAGPGESRNFILWSAGTGDARSQVLPWGTRPCPGTWGRDSPTGMAPVPPPGSRYPAPAGPGALPSPIAFPLNPGGNRPCPVFYPPGRAAAQPGGAGAAPGSARPQLPALAAPRASSPPGIPTPGGGDTHTDDSRGGGREASPPRASTERCRYRAPPHPRTGDDGRNRGNREELGGTGRYRGNRPLPAACLGESGAGTGASPVPPAGRDGAGLDGAGPGEGPAFPGASPCPEGPADATSARSPMPVPGDEARCSVFDARCQSRCPIFRSRLPFSSPLPSVQCPVPGSRCQSPVSVSRFPMLVPGAGSRLSVSGSRFPVPGAGSRLSVSGWRCWFPVPGAGSRLSVPVPGGSGPPARGRRQVPRGAGSGGGVAGGRVSRWAPANGGAGLATKQPMGGRGRCVGGAGAGASPWVPRAWAGPGNAHGAGSGLPRLQGGDRDTRGGRGHAGGTRTPVGGGEARGESVTRGRSAGRRAGAAALMNRG
ncbi:uncharacterized protein LOC143696146 isoform X2 [Agelaius phoeniceus]|uniref:uncharacterized protein LOC143696146 isoform X2 n=1 Tax=Agelaius phoeniceus TaxID=39638 RepID=UPI004054EBFC